MGCKGSTLLPGSERQAAENDCLFGLGGTVPEPGTFASALPELPFLYRRWIFGCRILEHWCVGSVPPRLLGESGTVVLDILLKAIDNSG